MVRFRQNMAASMARKIAAFVFAMAMVGSVAVGPALAGDDDVDVGGDGVTVGGDDGVSITVGDDGSVNGSTNASVSADEDGPEAEAEVSGGDGSGNGGSLDCEVLPDSPDCETSGGDGGLDTPDAEPPEGGDAPEAPSSGGSSDGMTTSMDDITTPEVPVDAPDLPVDYPDDVPFEAFPNVCSPPYGIDDVRDANPVDPTDPLAGTGLKEQAPEDVPTEPPRTPVDDPTQLIGAPISQCDVFNPYDPAVNPTDPPDDPRATVSPRQISAGQDGVTLFGFGNATTGRDEPGGRTMTLVTASQEFTGARLEASATDSQSTSGIAANIAAPTQEPNRGNYGVEATAFSRSAGVNIECDGEECEPTASGVPNGESIPAFPAGGGGDDGGEDPEPGPSADTGPPSTTITEERTVVFDDREATLGQGLPGGESLLLITRNGDYVGIRQDAQASQGDNQADLESTYTRGQFPGDDDVYVLAKGNGAGVIVGLNCDDYRCMPTNNTGVYPGPASMVFEMIPDDPGE